MSRSALIRSLSPDPPTVRIETVAPEILEEGKDDATLKCVTDANPPAKVLWRKEGLNGIFSPDKDITFSPVSRHTAGLYSCTAENVLGMSKEDYVQLDVKCKNTLTDVMPLSSCQQNSTLVTFF